MNQELNEILRGMFEQERDREKICEVPVDLARRLSLLDLKKEKAQFDITSEIITLRAERIPGCGSEFKAKVINEEIVEMASKKAESLEAEIEEEHNAIWGEIYMVAGLTKEQREEDYTLSQSTCTLYKYI